MTVAGGAWKADLCIESSPIIHAYSFIRLPNIGQVIAQPARNSAAQPGASKMHGRGSSKFNLAALEKQTDAFVEYCLDHPAEKAEAAMMQTKK